MSEITLLTIGPYNTMTCSSHDDTAIADQIGLTDYLGYRPIFCTQVFPDDLKETWFRLCMASPSYVECVSVFTIDENDVVPIDFAKWCADFLAVNHRTGETFDDFSNCLVKAGEHGMTDYLVREIPVEATRMRLDALLDKRGYLSLKKNNFPFMDIHEDIVDSIYTQQQSLMGSDGQEWTMQSTEARYMVALLSSPLLFFLYYGLIKKRSQIPRLSFTLAHPSQIYDEYVEALFYLDSFDNEDYDITDEDVNRVRERFYKLVDYGFDIAKSQYAKQLSIGVNDPCFCGSGKKYKKCHGRMNIQEFLDFIPS